AGYVPVTGSKISLNFDLDQNVVSIDYKPEKRSITVRYLDTRGQAIAQPDVIEGFYQESYTIKAKDIDGYTVVDSDSLIKRGIYDQDNMETAFIYRAGSDEFNAAVISLDEVLQQQNNKTTDKSTEVNVIKQTPKNLLNEFDLDD
ncbi:MAG: MucBP domain-containing protein, partial [Lactobacillus iners]|nr:MucBP domain-containing protein [Lactobacillus iners]